MSLNQNTLSTPSGDPVDSRKHGGSYPVLGMALLHGVGGLLFIVWAISGASAFTGLILTLTALVVLGNYSLKSTFVERDIKHRRETNEMPGAESNKQQEGMQSQQHGAAQSRWMNTEATSLIKAHENPIESSTVEQEKDTLARVTAEITAQEDQLATDILTNNSNSLWGSEIEQPRKAG